ncbi:ankyrin repeat domain-containing protein, partial [Cerasicoccus arenae]
NAPWTAQKWLPITQAAGAHGNRELIEFLLEAGADPTAIVGDLSDSATVVEMARFGKNEDLAVWLESQIAELRKIEPGSGGNG